MIKDIFHISNTITYLSLFASTLGILNALDAGYRRLTLLALIVAGICDLFDGVFARRFKRTALQKAIGVQLDSLVDVVNFGLLPLALLHAYGLRGLSFYGLAFIILACVIGRLAYFNAQESSDDYDFEGMPVTYVALFLPYAVFAGSFVESLRAPILAITLCVLAVLQISSIKFKRPSIKVYIFYVLLFIASIPLVWFLA